MLGFITWDYKKLKKNKNVYLSFVSYDVKKFLWKIKACLETVSNTMGLIGNTLNNRGRYINKIHRLMNLFIDSNSYKEFLYHIK